jgi:hypothetical protein
MTTLGVFRDDFYNPISTLPMMQLKTISQASGTIVASNLTGASECYLVQSGATALTTDTAVNIIAAIVSAIQANAAGAFPLPSIQNLTYTLSIWNTNGGTLTLTAGTGVTITGTATLATTVERQYMVTVTSPTTVTLTNLGGAVVT